MRKRVLAVIAHLLVLCLLFGMLSVCVAFGDSPDENLPYNIVLLIDRSGSMQKNDPSRSTLDCAKMFVGSLYHYNVMNQARGGGLNHTSIGVVAFSEEAKVITVPVDVSSQSGVNQVKQYIDSIEYHELYSGKTNLGTAVEGAVNLLKDVQDKDHRNMIVLFTDGYNEGLSGAETKQANELLRDALEEAGGMQCEIYVVGFDPEGHFSDEGKDVIRSIANSTQLGPGVALPDPVDTSAHSYVNYVITDSIKGVKDFYASVICNVIGDASQIQIYNGIIDLSDPGIIFATLFVYSESEEITDLHLFDPSGVEVPLAGGDILLDEGDSYTLISIPTPTPGIWNLQSTNLFDYDVSLMLITAVSSEIKVTPQGRTGYVVVQAFDGQALQGAPYYDNLNKLTCEVFDEAGNRVAEVPLTFNPGNSSMEGNFQVERLGTYTVLLTTGLSNNIERTASTTVDFFAPVKPIRVSVLNRKTVEIDLQSSYVPDWDNLVFNVDHVESDDEKIVSVSPVKNGSSVSIKGMKVGETYTKIFATDNQGQSWEFPVEVTVEFNILMYVPLFLLAAALIIALIIVVAKRKARPYFSGDLKMSVTMPSTMVDQTPAANDFHLKALQTQDDRSFPDIINTDFTISSQYNTALSGANSYLSKIKFRPRKKEDQSLVIILPAVGSGEAVKFGDEKIEKKVVRTLGGNTPITLHVECQNLDYHITLNFIPEEDISFAGGIGFAPAGGTDGFGDNAGGFGGFGDNAGGFGGFGGFGDNSGGFGGGSGGFGDNAGGSSAQSDNVGGFGAQNGSTGGSSAQNGSTGGFGGQNGSTGGFGGFGEF